MYCLSTESAHHTLQYELLVECIVGERGSAHAKLEARITLRYVQCRSVTWRACYAHQLMSSGFFDLYGFCGTNQLHNTHSVV